MQVTPEQIRLERRLLPLLLMAGFADGVAVVSWEAVQRLWSGYGMIWRCGLSTESSVMVKAIDVHAPAAGHPRGWTGDRSHQRKLTSYAVEVCFYRAFAGEIGGEDSPCRVPRFIGESCPDDAPWLLVMEDLGDAGFMPATELPGDDSGILRAGLDWLAAFHARFVGLVPKDLWPQGTYWHLATRPDELAAMADGPLKRRADELDRRLNDGPFTTLVHGDAKIANFCALRAGTDAGRLAAVDFQYVGAGCGIVDVAYFIGSVLSEQQCQQQDDGLLDFYAKCLGNYLSQFQPQLPAVEVVRDWLHRYPLAWADFTRFLQGWCPDHHKLHSYSQAMTQRALVMLDE